MKIRIHYSLLPMACLVFMGAPAVAKSFEKQNIKTMPQKSVQDFLKQGIWRNDNCQTNGNFQKFTFNNQKPLVEIGYGEDSEKLDIMAANIANNMLEIRTQVCAPIGCNHTFEQYKIINENKIFEWTFEGHLDGEPPNIVVAEGKDKYGAQGRYIYRCAK